MKKPPATADNHGTGFPMTLSSRVTVLGNYFINLFLVTGDNETALFETGISGITDAVISQLEALGVTPDYLIMSHPHSDHATGLPGLMTRFPDAVVLAGEGAREFITHPKAGPLMLAEDAFMSKGLLHRGITPGRPPIDTVPDLSDARIVTDTTILDLGGATLELKPVSGHSPGNLIARVQDIVFCSDSLGFHFPGRGFWPLFFTGVKAYLTTLSYIKNLAPAVICPAHQGPLKGDAAARGIQAAIDAAHAFINRVTHTRLPDQELLAQLLAESYRDEFTLYTEENIANCNQLLVKRARQFAA
ncbi:MAG: MBL fold metallo-hydrolase [Desulfotignum sp.]|jgi:glyoxylase-like metal-dependent hydrolase (beta-lactamase superfamily II)|nr:MBL fold metallo-hydrolase [Desulfotignum sp.]